MHTAELLREAVETARGLGFEVRSEPMSQGTPFANVLLVAQVAPFNVIRA